MKRADTRPVDASFHHGTHRQLLTNVPADSAVEAPLDALIVPTARPVHWLREAMKLAKNLPCGLVAMCSGAVKAAEVVELGEGMGVPVIAVDVAGNDYGLPVLSAASLLDHTIFERASDTSTKRNLALTMARVAGWERVLFLDDDIYGIDPGDARAAAGLLDHFDAVGMHNAGYPDNSVVCHAHRRLGAEQAEFIGAGALAVAPTRTRSFFPDVYNEDWFFLLGCGQPSRIAVTGRMRQKDYDPFADSDRARGEELGDCLAEGLFWLLDHRLPAGSADREHWGDFLSRRAYFVEHLLTEIHKHADDRPNRRVIASLQVARATCAMITPGLCSEYVHRWRHDLDTWRAFLDEQPVGLGIDKALQHLGWHAVVSSKHSWPDHPDDGAPLEDRLACSNGWADPTQNPESGCSPDSPSQSSQYAPAPA